MSGSKNNDEENSKPNGNAKYFNGRKRPKKSSKIKKPEFGESSSGSPSPCNDESRIEEFVKMDKYVSDAKLSQEATTLQVTNLMLQTTALPAKKKIIQQKKKWVNTNHLHVVKDFEKFNKNYVKQMSNDLSLQPYEKTFDKQPIKQNPSKRKKLTKSKSIEKLNVYFNTMSDGTTSKNIKKRQRSKSLSDDRVAKTAADTKAQQASQRNLPEPSSREIIKVEETVKKETDKKETKKSIIGKLGAVINKLFGAKEPLDMIWTKYYSYKDIKNYLHHLGRRYSDLVTVNIIGHTCEGRIIQAVRISGSYHSDDTIVIEAGIHAREWVTPTTATYLINFLLTNWNGLPKHLANKTWIFIPLLNPDGYHYSWTTDRLWRKNRNKFENSCYGVDLNRNFAVGWEDARVTDECHLNYKGPKPFSEKESQAVRNYLLPLKRNLKAYIAFHTYGQEVRLFWGLKEEIPNIQRVIQVAELGAMKMSLAKGEQYRVAPPRAHHMFGNSRDWARKELGVKYAYILELRDTGKLGFVLPESEIIPVAEEGFAFVNVIARAIDDDKKTLEIKAKYRRASLSRQQFKTMA